MEQGRPEHKHFLSPQQEEYWRGAGGGGAWFLEADQDDALCSLTKQGQIF